MGQDAFIREYLPELSNQAEARLYELALEYEQRCEAFDRRVCTGTRNGVAMPMNASESAQINRNAAIIFGTMMLEVERLGFDRKAFKEAIAYAQRSLNVSASS